ncbi:MBL fold metallo-hydrolase [Aestuariicella hydrocarbonica]|uniref:MBL fold metallo-hydrolase n=1 Tax=Pseudomaricurvus hydrocarbonicus TaxID=1470433 RepID=A0A9E5MJU8_9GAMM|nr:alkyl sulfatase dimerization domain-containing protein [Aestuariicella hydrocarbonica]NHO65664.1 MBL fold metallo-hydrolase [Aestuariicella hydrocarbonica]
MTASKQPLNATLVLDGEGTQNAIDLGDGIYMSKDVSNAYRVITSGGDVIINTGIVFSGDENFRRLNSVSDNAVAKIIFTQSHTDHVGGWRWFNTPETETIAQANFDHVYGYWEALRPTMARRSRQLWSGDIKKSVQEFTKPVITTTFHDSYRFELGGRQFELYSVKGGETIDSLVVWMPQEGIAFTGNMTGPIFGHVPNLYTLRGDKIRYVQWYLDSLQRVINLNPKVLITGHGEPLRGEAAIRTQLTRMRDAVQYIKDQTFKGMNDGIDLWTLMESIKLPPDLSIGQGHGKLPWLVRAIWEEHIGWFRYESSTELYNVPPAAIFADLIQLAGKEKVLEKAKHHINAGKILHAMHMAEGVLDVDAADLTALNIKLTATERLLEQNGRENFSEVRWLESQIRLIKAAIDEVSPC